MEDDRRSEPEVEWEEEEWKEGDRCLCDERREDFDLGLRPEYLDDFFFREDFVEVYRLEDLEVLRELLRDREYFLEDERFSSR